MDSRERKKYKANWAREKRGWLKVRNSEKITIDVPNALMQKLREGKPEGWGLPQFIVRKLQIQFGGKEIPVSAETLVK